MVTEEDRMSMKPELKNCSLNERRKAEFDFFELAKKN
jgi:hypothetical protein